MPDTAPRARGFSTTRFSTSIGLASLSVFFFALVLGNAVPAHAADFPTAQDLLDEQAFFEAMEGGGEPAFDTAVRLPEVPLPGLNRNVRVRRNVHNIPYIFALNDYDAFFALGYLHADDRFFQMDLLRRTFSGTLAELVGAAALDSDVQLRTLGLRRGAEESLAAVSPESRLWLEAYADGVNAWLRSTETQLPLEYTALELTSVPGWTAVDSLVIVKGLAFGLSFDLSDLDNTVSLLTFLGTGEFLGFDGTALFFEDLFRAAPFEPTVSIPGFQPGAAAGAAPPLALSAEGSSKDAGYLDGRSLKLIRDYREKARQAPLLAQALDRPNSPKGSNWWMISGSLTDTGDPILANDPHLGLDTPAVFYEVGIRIRGSETQRPMNVTGSSFAGTPAVVLGCNVVACWGATTNPMDVTDVYQEELVVDPGTGFPVATLFEGQPEPITLIPQTFLVNQPGNAVADDVVDAGIGPGDGGITLVVPRRNRGPIVAFDLTDPSAPLGLSVQYTGWRATREIDALRTFARAYSVDAFRDGVQYFDVGSQNWAYTDRMGNIAYFTSAEMPVREDLQLLMAPDGGLPPIFVRDGTHTLRHEWLPVANPQPLQSLEYEILPYSEMPQAVNPESGYILNCNNDPVGTTLDNNPLNQLRPGGGLYYLNYAYATGFRQGRIQRLVDAALARGDEISVEQAKGWQANNQLLDAEVLVPYLLDAYANAGEPGAPAPLAELRDDPRVAEAVNRLVAWDHSTPTGIQEGYDPGDDPTALPAPSTNEINASVAATLYSAWRGQVVQRVIDQTLAGIGLEGLGPGSAMAMAALRHHLDSFPTAQGVGASGIDFFDVAGVDDPAAERDIILLACLQDALDLLASDAFAPAFGNSDDQSDYRWGYLHRIVFEHPLGGPFDIPPGGGLTDLGPDLPGVARSGGLGALDASNHSARADGLNEFMFGSGPARRFAATFPTTGPEAEEVIPGGESGVPGSPFQTDQLLLWLTNQYHPLPYRPDEIVEASESFQVLTPIPLPPNP